MIAKYGKQEKYMPKFNDAMCDDYLIINLNQIESLYLEVTTQIKIHLKNANRPKLIRQNRTRGFKNKVGA